jgi:hypothetical protein
VEGAPHLANLVSRGVTADGIDPNPTAARETTRAYLHGKTLHKGLDRYIREMTGKVHLWLGCSLSCSVIYCRGFLSWNE